MVKSIIFGEIINSVPSPKAKPKQLAWKQHVASEVFNLTKNKVIDPSLTFAISLNMRFYPNNHPGKFDIDNFVKPILDGIAAGLFCDRGMDPSSFERFNFDDSNFKHLYVERLRDTTNPKEEGVAIVKVIKKICEKLDIDLEDEGINLVNYRGIENLTTRGVQQTIQIANKDNIPIFIIADNEHNAANKINRVRNSILSKFDFHIWNKDFEYDNFGIERVMRLVNKYLKKHNQKLSKKDISKLLEKNSLIRAIELAFRNKYKEDIYQKIPRKPDISLKLMEWQLRNMAKTHELGKNLPIENVMRKAFRLHTQWIPG